MYQFFQFILNKYQDGFVNGDEFTLLFNQAQDNYYDFLIGHVEQYQPGRPVPRIGMNMTETVSSKLAPFLKREVASAVTSQQVSKPQDFYRLIAFRDTDDNQIDRVEHDRKAYRRKSAVVVTPFYVDYDTYWEVLPDTVSAVNYEYYSKQPRAVTWAYTDVSGREVYDQVNSIDPLWGNADIYAIVARMLKPMGVRIDDVQVQNFAESVIQKGE